MFGKYRLRKVDEKKDGYKFAITFLAASLSFVYTIINYSEKTYIPSDKYLICISIVSAGILSIFWFSIYIILKGFSMELKKSQRKDHLDNMASDIYKVGLIIFLTLISFPILLAFKGIFPWVFSAYIIILSIFISSYSDIFASDFFRIKKDIIFKKYIIIKKNSKITKNIFIPIIMAFVFSIGLVILAKSAGFFAPSLLPGQTTVEIQSVYYKNDLQIPALIQLTGPDTTKLVILLFKETSGNLSEIANISLKNSSLDQEIKYNNYMLGNELGYGKYNVFINTTNLSTGYYELLIIRDLYYQNMSLAKGFFFLNSSKS